MALVRLALIALTAVVVSACGKTNGVPSFNRPAPARSAAIVSAQVVAHEIPYAIDAGTGIWESNNDITSSCTEIFNGGANFERGCMQPPAVTWSDSRWFVGFAQNYLGNSGLADFRYSLMANMTSSLLNGFFGGLGTGLGPIDEGRALRTDLSSASSRYMRFANFSNGDVVAVYQQDMPAGGSAYGGMVRVTYATVYDALNNAWKPATLLGTYNVTTPVVPTDSFESDRGIDYGVGGSAAYAHFCRPSVATAGVGRAMATWCEQQLVRTPATYVSQVMYSIYTNGTWSAPTRLVTQPGGNMFSVPGWSGRDNRPGTVEGGKSTIFNSDPTITIADGDDFRISVKTRAFQSGAFYADIATVEAVNGLAGAGQFKIEKDILGNVQVCPTLNNLVNALMSKPTNTQLVATDSCPASSSVTTRVMPQLGVSMVVNPNCSEISPSTWNVSTFYNRSLNSLMRLTERPPVPALNDYIENEVDDLAKFNNCVTCAGMGSCSGYNTYRAFPGPNPGVNTSLMPQSAQEDWSRSASADVAGDAFGNFAIVRSLVSPFFQDDDHTLSGTGRGRLLAGHQYMNNIGWVQRTGATAGQSEPATSLVSRVPSCFNGTNYSSCSVRNPKFLMSDSGRGLILFHQGQLAPASIASGVNPTRLYFATFGTSTGFSSIASPLDPDTQCSSASTANDAPVCETASYDITSSDISSACQSLPHDPSGIVIQTVNHDVPPIAAAMNRSGNGIVAFHKRVSTGTPGNPSCGNVATFATTYDAVNGFGNITQVDELPALTGNSMHSAVAIAENGNAAVVWETVQQGEELTRDVQLWVRVLKSGVWQAAVNISALSPTYTSPKDSMMPAVGINSSEVIVTFTYSPVAGGSVRRQFAHHIRY